MVTADKERLSSIRKRVGIRQTKPRLYYQWLQEEFEYGHAKVPRPSKKDHDADVLPYGMASVVASRTRRRSILYLWKL